MEFENIILHIDVNNAFLSWTALYLLEHGSKYDIRNSYAVIGGDEKKRSGIVLAKSMSAKKMGVVTGETLSSARRKCRVLKSYPPNFEYYSFKSNSMFELISSYTFDIEVASIDECYVDYKNLRDKYSNVLEFANILKQDIYDTLGFTVNIGIGNNKLCAKMASDFLKPNRIHTLFMDEVREKMWPLDIGDLFGVGRKSSVKLRELGINTIGDLANANETDLRKYFKNQAGIMIDHANGIDDSCVINYVVEPKGIGNEITLERDSRNKGKLYESLLNLSERIGERLRAENKYASIVVVILKDKDFNRRTHQRKLDNVINSNKDIFDNARALFDEMYNDDSIRLIGVRLDGLTSSFAYQISLFDSMENFYNRGKMDKFVDSINSKYGRVVVRRASLSKYKVKDKK